MERLLHSYANSGRVLKAKYFKFASTTSRLVMPAGGGMRGENYRTAGRVGLSEVRMLQLIAHGKYMRIMHRDAGDLFCPVMRLI